MIRSRRVPSAAPIAVLVMLWMAGEAITWEPGEVAPSPTPIPVTQQTKDLPATQCDLMCLVADTHDHDEITAPDALHSLLVEDKKSLSNTVSASRG